MASPISATIELRRCWTTERVIGSTISDMQALTSPSERDASVPIPKFTFYVILFCEIAAAMRRTLTRHLDLSTTALCTGNSEAPGAFSQLDKRGLSANAVTGS